MGVFDWIIGIGFTGWFIKNAARSMKEAKEEERRLNTKCRFNDGISKEEFKSIAIQVGNRFRRLSDMSVDGPIVYGTVQSQSGYSEWCFKIDFNDYGHLTGNYWLSSDNDDSNIPGYIGDAISVAIKDYHSNMTKKKWGRLIMMKEQPIFIIHQAVSIMI